MQINTFTVQLDLKPPFDKLSVGLSKIIGKIHSSIDPVALLEDHDRATGFIEQFRILPGRILYDGNRNTNQITLLNVIKVNKSVAKRFVAPRARIHFDPSGQRNAAQSHTHSKAADTALSAAIFADRLAQGQASMESDLIHSAAVVDNSDLGNLVGSLFLFGLTNLFNGHHYGDVRGAGLNGVVNDLPQAVLSRIVIVPQRFIHAVNSDKRNGMVLCAFAGVHFKSGFTHGYCLQ